MQKTSSFDALIDICKYHFRTIDEPVLVASLLRVQDWQHFIRLSSYHAVRPVVYDVLRQFQQLVPPDVMDYLRRFAFTQSNHNAHISCELERFLVQFEAQGIQALPLGGIFFLNQLYDKSQLRETGDIELAVPAENMQDVAQIFIDNDYAFCDTDLSLNDLAIGQLKQKSKNKAQEIRLQNKNILIVLSCNNCATNKKQGFDFEAAFGQLGKMKFFSTECLLPTPEVQLLMMVSRHGSGESWLKLKHLCDLMAFHQKYGKNLYWASVFSSAQQQQTQQALGVGLELLKLHFGVTLNKSITLKKTSICDQILSIWRVGTQKMAWDTTLRYQKVKQQLASDLTIENDYFKYVLSALKIPQFNSGPMGLLLKKAFLFLFLKNL